MKMTDKVAYIGGLMEGLDLDQNKKEVKVLEEIGRASCRERV